MLYFIQVLLFIQFASCEIIRFQQHHFTQYEPEYWSIPKYASSEVPHWSPGKGKSYIDLSHLKFNTICRTSGAKSCEDSTLELLMFEEPDGGDWVDYWSDGQFCCTSDMADSGSCKVVDIGKLIRPSELLTLYKHLEIPAGKNSVSLTPEDLIFHHDIDKTGVFVILMASCGASPNSDPAMSGDITSLDPFGYLPADQFPFLPFYGLLSLAYTLIAFAWIVLCFVNRNELIVLQYWISAVLSFGLLETALEYGYFLNWNDSGDQHVGVAIAGSVFAVCKRALSRVVIQFVALGYGIVRPSLGDDLWRVLVLGTSYFVLSCIYTLSVKFSPSSSTMSDPEYNFISLVILMLAGVDTTFYIWTITSINSLVVTLAARKLVMKYVLYRNFRYVLFASLFLTFVWVIYGSFQTVSDGYGSENNWKLRWTVDALWELTYFGLFVAVCVMWAPFKNSSRFSYTYEMVNLDDDEEYQSISAAATAAAEDDGTASGHADDGDEENPFKGSGALDSAMAVSKSN